MKALLDMEGALVLITTNSTHPVRLTAKQAPGVPLLVITQKASVARQSSLIHGAVPVMVDPAKGLHTLDGVMELVSGMGGQRGTQCSKG